MDFKMLNALFSSVVTKYVLTQFIHTMHNLSVPIALHSSLKSFLSC